jgi:hypothetical protein
MGINLGRVEWITIDGGGVFSSMKWYMPYNLKSHHLTIIIQF